MKKTIFILCWIAVFTACDKPNTPKPYGYVRIDIPDTTYSSFSPDGYPYSFRLSDNATIDYKTEKGEHYWIDIRYPRFNARIHCSYKPVNNDLYLLSQESENFVYKHAQIANAIPEQGYENPDEKVYGVLYEIQGNTASPYQFILTDSTNHFFRGALYFNCTPNQDSLAPVISYIKTDIVELIESFKWK